MIQNIFVVQPLVNIVFKLLIKGSVTKKLFTCSEITFFLSALFEDPLYYLMLEYQKVNEEFKIRRF